MSRVNEILTKDTPRSSVVFSIAGKQGVVILSMMQILYNTGENFIPIIITIDGERIVVNSIRLLKFLLQRYNTFVFYRNVEQELDMFPANRGKLRQGEIQRISNLPFDDIPMSSILEATEREKTILQQNLNRYMRHIEFLKNRIRHLSNAYADSIGTLTPDVQRQKTELIVKAQDFLKQYDEGRDTSTNLGDMEEIMRGLDRMSVVSQQGAVRDMRRVADDVRAEETVRRMERMSVAPPPRLPERRIPIIPFQQLTSRRDDYRDKSPVLEQPRDADVPYRRGRRVLHSSDEEEGGDRSIYERDYHPAGASSVLRDRDEIDSILGAIRAISFKEGIINDGDSDSYSELLRLQNSLSVLQQRIDALQNSYRKSVLINSLERVQRAVENRIDRKRTE